MEGGEIGPAAPKKRGGSSMGPGFLVWKMQGVKQFVGFGFCLEATEGAPIGPNSRRGRLDQTVSKRKLVAMEGYLVAKTFIAADFGWPQRFRVGPFTTSLKTAFKEINNEAGAGDGAGGTWHIPVHGMAATFV